MSERLSIFSLFMQSLGVSLPSGTFHLAIADEWVVKTPWWNRIIKYRLQAFGAPV